MTRLALNTTKGLAFTRACIGHALKDDDPGYARKRWGEQALPTRIAGAGGMSFMMMNKGAVPAGSTLAGNWAQLLVDTESAAAEFFSLVRERSLLSRLPGLRGVPLLTRMLGLATGFSAAWVGEGKAIPVGSATFSQETLPARKLAGIGVFTEELLRSADPKAEMIIRDDMVKAISEAIDQGFIDTANAGVPDVAPPSITYGVTPVLQTGSAREDIKALIADFKGDLENAVLIGSPETFADMADPLELPRLGVRGGDAIGIPAVPTKAIGDSIALVDPTGIAIGDAGVDITVSREATIEMSDTPTGDSVTPTGTSMVSLFQTDSVAILVTQTVNWQAARPSVSVMDRGAAS
jgi:hypothetical protein